MRKTDGNAIFIFIFALATNQEIIKTIGNLNKGDAPDLDLRPEFF